MKIALIDAGAVEPNGCWAECFDRPYAGPPEDADDRV